MKRIISFIASAALLFSASTVPADTVIKNACGDTVMTALADNERVEMTKGAGQVLPDGDYMIKSSLSYVTYITTDEKVYTEEDKHTPVHTSNLDLSWGKHSFRLTYLNNGYYSITQTGSNMCFDVPTSSNGVEDGKPVEFYMKGSTPSTNQQWSIEPTELGYRIRSRYCSKCMQIIKVWDAMGGRSDIGLYPQDDRKDQAFTFIPYIQEGSEYDQSIKFNEYNIRSAKNGLWVDAAGFPLFAEGTNIEAYTKNDDSFNIGVHISGYYDIIEKSSYDEYYKDYSHEKLKIGIDLGEYKDDFYQTKYDRSSEYAEGARNVGLYENKDRYGDIKTEAQLWMPIKNSDGTFTFVNQANGYALTAEDNYNITARIRDGSDAQNWYIIPTDGLPGDANDDGSVTVDDVLLIQQHIAGWKVNINTNNANVTGDNDITIEDALLIQQKIAGWNVTLV